MALALYNTLTKTKDTFKPLVGNQVRMYVCGMTVYDFCHIGHARVMVAFDVVARWFRHRGYDLTYVRNITDIDDKIIKRANENGETFEQLTERMIAAMHEDEARLNVLRPDQEPRASQHIEGMFSMIQTLIDKGYAYAPGNGDVYYRVGKFEGYGKLSRRKIEDLKIGARIEVDEAKQDPLDFVLWKAAKPGEPSWTSPWGEGRPGWHIECSVMSTCCLGNTFDIHGGGPDLVFPHHENEIAQSEAATGEQYAAAWMHAGAVRVDGEKMSKSLGNFFTIREVLEKYHPEVVRYLLVSSHYRSAINYSEDNLKEAKGALERFYIALKGLPDAAPAGGEAFAERFGAAMDDDFNSPEACAVLFEMVREVNRLKETDVAAAAALAASLRQLAEVLGVLQLDADTFLQAGAAGKVDAAEVEALIAARLQARADKNWAESDRIRDQLTSMGVVLEDGKGGTTWRLAD
ncbi:MAG TPA: cysteine--tRNA ligase [Pseudomonas sp.]|jgi:cysteinyl-tRNA synthetase|uniref:Cysteine--tRNA ligase n=1 Tax=Halopseudomonas pachastrellae TaxID=254161 RepID=A0A1S8DJR0_9GAMM|nr:cysteine--tRNA ligase [Halopseudomonas pachastrellae]MAQ52814.1 cysteine--tRNA ligase [Pseudomonas sp.]MED5491363.1 cysteine--tRNA ligase [Pseudomonadota bacterium]ONM45046.1 cysteine--tRNA ligase [Halopseudomonas pachastrellae]SFM17604.1 cysteinyl-tRNA synthetase [Halopseudomonas pachastrellae]HCA23246.1 cysteine--tRNA ligase [Pseudomonas sp.]|tara:strand:+ start:3330 stop:4715 length:1386 start_codon:yes stop_codon:yes gene_type:complete